MARVTAAPILAPNLPGDHVVVRLDHATVDWTDGLVYAAGYDDTGSTTQAWEQAVENLIEGLLRLNVDPDSSCANVAARRPVFLAYLYRLVLQNAQTALATNLAEEDGASVCVLILHVRTSGFMPFVLEGLNVASLSEPRPMPTPIPRPATAGWLKEIRHPTGLVLDARKVDFQPSLCPAIYAQDGRLVFDKRYVRRVSFMQDGMCSFTNSLDEAKREARVGINPKVVEVISTTGLNGGDLVVSDNDAERLIFLRKRFVFLSKCRIAIVCNPCE